MKSRSQPQCRHLTRTFHFDVLISFPSSHLLFDVSLQDTQTWSYTKAFCMFEMSLPCRPPQSPTGVPAPCGWLHVLWQWHTWKRHSHELCTAELHVSGVAKFSSSSLWPAKPQQVACAISSGDAAETLCRLSFASAEVFVLTSGGAVLAITEDMTPLVYLMIQRFPTWQCIVYSPTAFTWDLLQLLFLFYFNLPLHWPLLLSALIHRLLPKLLCPVTHFIFLFYPMPATAFPWPSHRSSTAGSVSEYYLKKRKKERQNKSHNSQPLLTLTTVWYLG